MLALLLSRRPLDSKTQWNGQRSGFERSDRGTEVEIFLGKIVHGDRRYTYSNMLATLYAHLHLRGSDIHEYILQQDKLYLQTG